MMDYVRNGKVIEATLENGKVIKMESAFIDKMMTNLGIDEEDAVLTWLEDEEYIINEDQEELNKEAKDNKVLASLHRAKDNKTVAAKKQVKRTVKENPTKELIIATVAKTIENIDGATDVVVENKGKIITFKLNGEDYKIDLVQKRKPKATK